MAPIQSFDHNPMRAAHEAPRCQHIRLNGRRCAAPALRGDSHCHFHNRIEGSAMDAEPFFPFPEDATSLQYAIARVMRMLLMGQVEYKRCALLLYSLQIACANLKNFTAEQPQPEAADGERPRPKIVSGDKEKKTSSKNGDEPSLAELLLGLLAKGENGDPAVERPRIRSREDYQAAVEQKQRSSAASPRETAAR